MGNYHGLDWVLTIVLAIVFITTGVVKIFRFDIANKRFTWASQMSRPLVVLIGVLEILGALGVILPVATGIFPFLTTVAAAGLTLLMFMSVQFHVIRHESDEAWGNFVITVLLGVLTYMRWPLLG